MRGFRVTRNRQAFFVIDQLQFYFFAVLRQRERLWFGQPFVPLVQQVQVIVQSHHQGLLGTALIGDVTPAFGVQQISTGKRIGQQSGVKNQRILFIFELCL